MPAARSSWRILPGCCAVATSTSVPWRHARVRSVVSATERSTGSVSSAVSRQSRPNRVKNQGAPAAKKDCAGSPGTCRRSASRSERERRSRCRAARSSGSAVGAVAGAWAASQVPSAASKGTAGSVSSSCHEEAASPCGGASRSTPQVTAGPSAARPSARAPSCRRAAPPSVPTAQDRLVPSPAGVGRASCAGSSCGSFTADIEAPSVTSPRRSRSRRGRSSSETRRSSSRIPSAVAVRVRCRTSSGSTTPSSSETTSRNSISRAERTCTPSGERSACSAVQRSAETTRVSPM